MKREDYSDIVAFIWKIADEVLRDNVGRTDYQKIILPMLVLRRFDLMLAGKIEKVKQLKKELEAEGYTDIEDELCYAAKLPFYNTSGYTLESMRGKPGGRLKTDFNQYINGFSANVKEILEKFKFFQLKDELIKNNTLLALIERFLDSKLDLQSLDNHAIGTVFEELVRKFSEDVNEEAGAYWTPRDAVGLMTELVFSPAREEIKNGTYSIYDGACGTGGMLTIAEETLKRTGAETGKDKVICKLYGQENRADIYAICKADMLLRSTRTNRKDELIHFGSTLSADQCLGKKFRFMLSNPPFGKHWKEDKKKMESESGHLSVENHGKNKEILSLIPRISDGQMLFLVNLIHKMGTEARIAQVHNGSSLFTGEAGSGESNIRRWIIENDWLEAIIALPENMFYNTGITTYIWVISNNKAKKRKGKIQLIDASEWFTSLRRNLGFKNCELSGADIEKIMSAFGEFKETEKSKIFPNKEFGYWQIAVHRPLRLRGQLSAKSEYALLFASGERELREKIYKKYGRRLFSDFAEIREEVGQYAQEICDSDKKRAKLADGKIWAKDKQLSDNAARLRKVIGGNLFEDFNVFRREAREAGKQLGISKPDINKILDKSSWRDADAPPVEKENTAHKSANPLYGIYEETRGGKTIFVEYQLDSELKDTERVPLLHPGGIADFVEREVRPYASDIWVEKGTEKIGYEISFNRYFYHPQPLRALEDIHSDIQTVQKNAENLLSDLLVEKKP